MGTTMMLPGRTMHGWSSTFKRAPTRGSAGSRWLPRLGSAWRHVPALAT